MTTLVAIGAPSVLLTLILEAREGRIGPLAAGLDGGIAILSGALALRACGAV